MAKSLPSHIEGLISYLSSPEEKANEDRALAYFRKVFGDTFTRQKEAKRADGYVAGHFVLELKGKTSDWLSGLFQGLAYRKTELDFSQIVVAAKNFLAIWQVEDLPEMMRDEILAASGAPNALGKFYANEYSEQRGKILKLAVWNSGVELSGRLFVSQPELVISKIQSFEKTLKEGRKIRRQVTLKNFTKVLKEMTQFFDPAHPIKAVRAFYSMSYGWNSTSTLQLSQKAYDQATLGGEVITNLRPAARQRFKEFVENHAIVLGPNEDHDDYFAAFDKALDAVDRGFRIKHGIFFTDLHLSRFVMWFVKRDIPELGKNYLVIDPACGSGNLVTNWRSPLQLRHKVVSEIEPELLFAVEKRMKGDQWHNGKFTVVPKVSENKGLNFLDQSAEDYLREIKKYLAEKGLRPDKPLAFLCNPPYRSDDDQATKAITYKPHATILEITGSDAGSERYCCFLAQMKLICDIAESSGLPDDSLLLLFTKSAWLTKRAIFDSVRTHVMSAFEDCGGMLVNGSEFFDVKGSWPVAFTVWRYKGKHANLNPHRSVPLIDLTWLKRDQLVQIPWETPDGMEQACKEIIGHPDARTVELGQDRMSLKVWSGETRHDFMRGKRKAEKTQRIVGGLPAEDRRHDNKKAYGETHGAFIGFMDDLTPCRIKNSQADMPWLRLNNQFMDVKKNRCFSGPPTHFGYCAYDLASAKKLFFWYALARTFIQHPYPMWIDADDLWAPPHPERLTQGVFQAAFAIGFAENECIEARFPANNPVKGVLELTANNPMTPHDPNSFWSAVMRPYLRGASRNVVTLVASVDQLFCEWRKSFGKRTELPISDKPYLLDDMPLTLSAGIVQIRDYARDTDDQNLLQGLSRIQEVLKSVKTDFFGLVTSSAGLDYFARGRKAIPRTVKFHRTPAEAPGPKKAAATRQRKHRAG